MPLRYATRTLALGALAALLLTPSARAVCDELDWGQVPEEHVAMTAYEPDPDASAVILGDCGETEMGVRGGDLTIFFERHVRVKILTEAGYEAGDVVLRYSNRADENIRNVRGHTLVPQPDGSVRTVELDRGSIFEEATGEGFREIRFTLPALEPGAIVEFAYERLSENPYFLPSWAFQGGEPTLYSSYKATIPDAYEYAVVSNGLPGVAYANREVRHGGGYEAHEHVWEARDMPALREEPYLTTLDDYRAILEFQLRAYRDSRYGTMTPVMSNWETMAQELDENGDFGRQIQRHRAVREQAEALTAGLSTPREKLDAIYTFLATSMVWNEQGGIFLRERNDRALEARTGSGADINMLLLSMLRDAGIEAQPLLISTRSHGRVRPQYPLLTQFNHLIVAAEVDGEILWLDATDPDRPAGMLPVRALSGAGWMPRRGAPQWVTFEPGVRTGTTTFVEGTLAPDGTLGGTMQLRLTGYDALRARHRLREEEASAPGEAASSAASEASEAADDVDIAVVEVTGVEDPAAAIVLRADVSATGAEAVGDVLYFSPFVLMGLDENPFQLERRTYPVDFAYPFTRTYSATITLPEGYVPEEMPGPVQLFLPEQTVTYLRTIQMQGDQLVVQARLQVNGTLFQPNMYPMLRQLYDEIVAVETEAIALVPEAATAEPEAATEAPADGGEEGEGGR